MLSRLGSCARFAGKDDPSFAVDYFDEAAAIEFAECGANGVP